MSSNKPEVVVTAGGTKESIDDVRYIGNFSSGALGHELATAYARLGHSVLLLAPNDTIAKFGVPENVEHRPFTSAASLEDELLSIDSAYLVLHAAAVSDYTVKKVKGKMSSSKKSRKLHLEQSPKILPQLRAHFGQNTTIVGFKLLSNVDESELFSVASDQISSAHTDLCIANDLQSIGKERTVYIVQP